MTRTIKGFSLIELLVALTIALILSAMMFQLFHQNERVIRDQTLIMEMQQTARIVASQIEDEIRMAGQGVPVYAANFDTVPTEAVAVILGSSSANRIDFRAGLSNVETRSSGGGSNDFTLGMSRSIPVESTSGFTSGKFVYIFGPSANLHWAWLRAQILAVTSTTLSLMPCDSGTTDATVHFAGNPTITMEEAVSIYLSNGTVRHTTATNMTNLSSPVWAPANEIGKNFTALAFTYYDAKGNFVQPSSLANRTAIARVDVQMTVAVSSPLSNGARRTYSLATRTVPRNMRLRFEN